MRIIVPSSDITSWALQGCLHLLDKYWPQHPAVLIGGYTPPPFPLPSYATFHRIGKFADYPSNKWSDGLLALLESITDDIFCYMMDDFWLVRPVDHYAVEICARTLRRNPHLARIDLTADRANSGWEQDDETVGHVRFVSTPPLTPYQLSFQAGLWRRGALIQYLKPGEGAGDTELRGSHRMTLANSNVLGTRNEPVKYKIVVQHGRVVVNEAGYQVPAVNIPDEDYAELAALGYLTPPERAE